MMWYYCSTITHSQVNSFPASVAQLRPRDGKKLNLAHPMATFRRTEDPLPTYIRSRLKHGFDGYAVTNAAAGLIKVYMF